MHMYGSRVCVWNCKSSFAIQSMTLGKSSARIKKRQTKVISSHEGLLQQSWNQCVRELILRAILISLKLNSKSITLLHKKFLNARVRCYCARTVLTVIITTWYMNVLVGSKSVSLRSIAPCGWILHARTVTEFIILRWYFVIYLVGIHTYLVTPARACPVAYRCKLLRCPAVYLGIYGVRVETLPYWYLEVGKKLQRKHL